MVNQEENLLSAKSTVSHGRRYDNDWLTVLAMLLIFLFHCARFFNFGDWHVKNNQLNGGLSIFVSIVAQWIMPLFFILSGINSNYSLNSRGGDRYIGNRFQRLVIPFLFGTFVVLVPLQVWIERVSHSQLNCNFFEFYPRYFRGFYGFGGNFAWMGLHLWYLQVLFVFTLLTFPLFNFLKNSRAQKSISGTAAFLVNYKAIFLLALLLFMMEWLVNLYPEGIGRRDFGGWSPFSYLIVFIAGFLLASDSRYREVLERFRFVSAALALLTTGWIFFFSVDLRPLGNWAYTLKILFRSFNSWFWLMAVLGFGSRFLSADHKALRYAREAVLPFYILHQTIIVLVGFYIAGWKSSVLVKYIILSTLSFIAIIAVYALLIKRVKVLRYLFGMKVGNERN